MATQTYALEAHPREKLGSTGAAALRRAGKVPGVLYGHETKPVALALDARALDELLHAGGKNHLLVLTIAGGASDTALIRDVQRDPLSRKIVHVDLQRVSATEEVAASLPLVTVGVADGVRNFGAVMDVIVHAVDVKAPANALPEQIEVDVTALGVGGHVVAGDLVLPPKVKLAMDPHALLISIEPSRTEAAAAAEAAPAPADVPTVAESTAETA
jgi:large subunit ribosomal protein L25